MSDCLHRSYLVANGFRVCFKALAKHYLDFSLYLRVIVDFLESLGPYFVFFVPSTKLNGVDDYQQGQDSNFKSHYTDYLFVG